MISKYHVQITTDAVGGRFDSQSLSTIVRANLGQDRLLNLLGHPEIHFDDSQFAVSEDYIQQQRQQAVVAMVEQQNRTVALQALGRLLHGRQDFYAHSNWVALWVDRNGGLDRVTPDQVALCLDPLAEPALISGTSSAFHYLACRVPIYGPFHQRRFVPATCHEAMNLDDPSRGPLFPFAIAAATRHSALELDMLLKQLSDAGGPDLASSLLSSR